MLIIARVVFPAAFFTRKKAGIPISAALPKQINWRLVRLKKTLDLTLDKSRGTGIYAANARLLSAGLSGVFFFHG